MRIKLSKGKQKALILLAKRNKTWSYLGNKLKIPFEYLARDLKNEKVLISEVSYRKLCSLANKNFDRFILKKLNNDWGRSKGGLNSKGSLIHLSKIKFDSILAEFVGAVLGDGHVFYKSQNGVYGIRIAGDLNLDKNYHIKYLKKLCKSAFNLEAKEIIGKHGRFLNVASKELVEFFILMGINPGNKIKNQSTIPSWIWKNKSFLSACLRGLIDTDGSIFRMSNKDSYLIRINFTNYNKTLLEDARQAFVILGFHPSKIINNRNFCLSRQQEIEKYLKEVGFSNIKHTKRLQNIKSRSVAVKSFNNLKRD